MKKEILRLIVIIILLWISITCFINAIKNPKLSQTELLLKIPKSTFLKFE